ncbi:MAG TPA: TerC family protein [Enteractinococcus helveticum]|uniref:TerC family protein n=1 Tax=Enteractinococcus helveticum TaxID=1837282 RepID=A0A921K886_9MICC|nr:TerC family protein [Enteractinococcus helveticum]HJF13674.1 TerC family protein [Enteractinococcus helveticum]
MEITGLTWAVTIAAIIGLVFFDYFFHVRKAHTPTLKEAAIWSSIYVGVALAFGLVFFALGDTDHAIEYYAGFITEKALSVDNLFVFMIIMTSFAVPRQFQQKVLLFGITFALISRTIFILLGAAILEWWSDAFYIFGIFLLLLAGQQLKSEFSSAEEAGSEADNALVRFARKVLPVAEHYDGDKIITRLDGKRLFTPMLLVMVAIGVTDLIFALDSIPAIFGLTQESYIVFTANAFALLGLRQLYFLIDGLLDRLVYLGYGLAAILGFIGVKLMLHALHQNNLPFINDGEDVPVIEISTGFSLLVIIGILITTIAFSLLSPKGKALRALQNAEKFAHRYTLLPEDATVEQRQEAAEKMDFWTHRAQETEHRYLEELIEHKDQWSAIIRLAHETRLEDANRRGIPALMSQRIVTSDGPVLAPNTNGKDNEDSEARD